MQENQIKRIVREGGVAIGTNINEFPTRALPKLLEYAKLDWAFVDMEHTGMTMDRVADLLAWFKSTSITVLVRPPDNMYHMIAGLMDAGAMGVFAPKVDSAAEARQIVEAAMYPPLGNRGVGLNAAHTDFKQPKAAEYMPARNAQTSIVASIESPEGLANVDEIAAVEGIDIIHPSQTDLSISMGIPQDFAHPRFREAQTKVLDACRRHGKASMFIPRSDADLKRFYEQGCRVILMRGICDIFEEAMKSEAERWRGQAAALAG